MPRADPAPRVERPASTAKHALRIAAKPEAVARTVLLGGAPPKNKAILRHSSLTQRARGPRSLQD